EAARRGLSGEATVQGTISPQGTLEGCEVTWENPPGMGFGNAALLLTPSFLLKPGLRDGKPVSTSVSIPISFKTDGSFSGDRLEMISNPLWAAAPSFADMAAAWPSKAKAAFGHVSMRCGITPEGGLRSCDVLTETPGMQGFGKAAMALAPKFRLLINGTLEPKLAKAEINLPIRFTNPAAAGPRVITKPKWITTIDPEKVVSIFPYEAAEAGVKSGRGVADCLVAPNGKLVDCKAAPATPEGLGFSEAAVQVASIMIMNPWSDGGGPVDGVRLRLPVSFNLALEQEAKAPKP
ncbi:MAG TPA: energy transducer TonB, partial [Arenibaculum sp.]|nr:energy transducer TonB [Arenibaculum sp.]